MGVRTRVSIIDFIIKKMRRAIAIVEDTDTASRNIASGKYVLWKGVLTKASAAISSGTTLSSSNLTSLDDGAINDLDERINEKINTSAIANNLTTTAAGYVLDARQGKTINDKVSAWRVAGEKSLTLTAGGYWLIVTRYNATVNSVWVIYAYNGNAMGSVALNNSASISMSMGSGYKLTISGNVSTSRGIYIGS